MASIIWKLVSRTGLTAKKGSGPVLMSRPFMCPLFENNYDNNLLWMLLFFSWWWAVTKDNTTVNANLNHLSMPTDYIYWWCVNLFVVVCICIHMCIHSVGAVVLSVLSRLSFVSFQSYIKCKHIDYMSSRTEPFYDIQINIKGKKDSKLAFCVLYLNFYNTYIYIIHILYTDRIIIDASWHSLLWGVAQNKPPVCLCKLCLRVFVDITNPTSTHSPSKQWRHCTHIVHVLPMQRIRSQFYCKNSTEKNLRMYFSKFKKNLNRPLSHLLTSTFPKLLIL